MSAEVCGNSFLIINQIRVILQNFIEIMGALLIKVFKAMKFIHWLNLSLIDLQFIASNSFWDIHAILSKLRQKLVYLLCEMLILFFSFQKEKYTTLSKHNQNKFVLRPCIVSDADWMLNIYFSSVKPLVFH